MDLAEAFPFPLVVDHLEAYPFKTGPIEAFPSLVDHPVEASSSKEEVHHTLAATLAEVVASWEAWAFTVTALVKVRAAASWEAWAFKAEAKVTAQATA